MLPKHLRFSTEDFKIIKSVKTKKLIVNIGFFVIFPENTVFLNKKAIVLSKKNFKTAVKRNFYKRLFYNTLLEEQVNNQKIKDLCFIFYPNKIFVKEDLASIFLNMVQ